MADLSIAPANVVPAAGAVIHTGFAGEALTPGKPVYRSSSTRKWMVADSNSASAEAKKAVGIALTGSALNQPVVVLESGDVAIGATLVAGAAYYLSDSGGICPVADVGAGEFVCQLGLAKSTTTLSIDIRAPGVTL